VVAGFFNGVGGAEGGTYDANGHYLKSFATIQASGVTLTGLVNTLGTLLGSVEKTAGVFDGARSRLLAPCPGGGNPPVADRSSPWNKPDVVPEIHNLCNQADNQRP
jgi:hypothetical protein